MRALLDLDPIVYRIGFASQKKDKETGEVVADPLAFCLHSVKVFIQGCLREVNATTYTGYLTGVDNFRSIVDPEYKMNRKGAPKPVHYQAIRDYMVAEWGAKVVDGSEADDAVAYKQGKDTVICTIDKDLKMVAGLHYNYVKKEMVSVTQKEGDLWFYAQMLCGDNTDNIPGIKGIGMKTAIKKLEAVPRKDWDEYVYSEYVSFKEYADTCVAAMTDADKELDKNYDFVAFSNYSPFQRMCMNSQLLWMIQKDVLMPIDFKGMMG